jgi:FkbM family methyltransferase
MEYFEVPTAEWSLQNLRRLGFAPARILDIGAYKGEWTQLARQIFPEATVLMLEAQEERIPDLEAVKLGHGGKVDYQIVLLGAEDRPEVVFNKYPNAPTGNSVLNDWRTDSLKIQAKCRMRPLDAVLQETGFMPVDLIKLDVQGYELEVLKGGLRCLQSAQAVMMEVSLIDMYQGNPLLHDVAAFMHRYGFVAYDVCGLMRRPLDMALAQVDMLFVPERCALRACKQYGRGDGI